MDDEVQSYIDEIPADRRPLFDRVQSLLLAAFPRAEVRLSYKMPTYQVGERSLHVAAWAHGVSFYGWQADRDGGFAARHPEMSSGRGTIRLRAKDAAGIPDEELTAFFRAALGEDD